MPAFPALLTIRSHSTLLHTAHSITARAHTSSQTNASPTPPYSVRLHTALNAPGRFFRTSLNCREVEYMQRQCCAEFRLHSRFYQAGPRGQPEYQHSFGGVRQASIHEKYSSCNTKECICRVFQVLRWSAHLRSIPR